MTIKICKQKFDYRLGIFGAVLMNVICIALIVLPTGAGVYFITMTDPTGVQLVIFGLALGIPVNIVAEYDNKRYWLRLILKDKKIKIFEWRYDC